jgi:hypothetical protein
MDSLMKRSGYNEDSIILVKIAVEPRVKSVEMRDLMLFKTFAK